MNQNNKNYTHSSIVVYNNFGQVVNSIRFLPETAIRYFEYKRIKRKKQSKAL